MTRAGPGWAGLMLNVLLPFLLVLMLLLMLLMLQLPRFFGYGLLKF